jgi:hypothetical protein
MNVKTRQFEVRVGDTEGNARMGAEVEISERDATTYGEPTSLLWMWSAPRGNPRDLR